MPKSFNGAAVDERRKVSVTGSAANGTGSFNGAAVDERRKEPSHSSRTMGDTSFNGAAVDERRKEAQAVMTAVASSRFNGAAVDERRKGLRRLLPLHRDRASMGPPSMNGGRRRRQLQFSAVNQVLQWGRRR